MKKMFLIISREYSERARKKSFIITTLLTPILMIGIMIAPSLMMLYNTSDQKQIVVVDRSGLVADKLQSSEELLFTPHDNISKSEACQIYNEESGIFAILYIGSEVEQRDSVQLITNASSSMMLESNITSQLNEIIEQEKLRKLNIENL